MVESETDLCSLAVMVEGPPKKRGVFGKWLGFMKLSVGFIFNYVLELYFETTS